MAAGALPIQRGCGRRKAGGIYAELGLGPGGSPVEHFLLDVPIPADNLSSVTPVGVSTLVRDGVTHVLDWIGQEHYPNVADFIEEVRVAGLSRRLPSTFDFSRLTPESRLLTIHARAWVDNAKDYRPGLGYPCPKKLEAHRAAESVTCLGIVWEDVEGGDSIVEHGDENQRAVLRTMPGFSYTAKRAPDGVTGEYRPAIFGSWPIGRLAVVRDEAGGTHEKGLKVAGKSTIEVAEVEE